MIAVILRVVMDRLDLKCMNGTLGEDVKSDRVLTFICCLLSNDPRRFVFPMTAPEKYEKN